MKFKLLEENELEKRAKFNKSTDKKGARGWFVHPNPGDPESIKRFNDSVAKDAKVPTNATADGGIGEVSSASAPSAGGAVGEALEKHKFAYSGPVYRFMKPYAEENGIYTYAVSIPAADRNICMKLKNKYGFERSANLSIDRSKIVQVDDNKVDSTKKSKYTINVDEDNGTVEILRNGVVEMTFPSIEAAEEVLSNFEVQ